MFVGVWTVIINVLDYRYKVISKETFCKHVQLYTANSDTTLGFNKWCKQLTQETTNICVPALR